MELSGPVIPARATVLLAFRSACHDDEQFPQPRSASIRIVQTRLSTSGSGRAATSAWARR